MIIPDKQQKKKIVHCFFLLDESGSMNHIREDVTGGLIEFFNKQKEEADPKDTLTFWTFNSTVNIRANGVYLKTHTVDKKQYSPNGTTALYDAIGNMITSKEFKKAQESGDQVLFVIQTDGEENSSKEWSGPKIIPEIEKLQKDDNTTVVFLGQGLEGFKNSTSLNINSTTSLNYEAHNTKKLFGSAMGQTVNCVRASGKISNTSELLKDILDKKD